MASASDIVERAKAYLEDARDPNLDVTKRVEAFDALRAALLEARRARARPEELLPTFNALCTAAISDPSHLIRNVVPQAVEDLCLRDLNSFTPTGTDFLSRSLDDEHVLVVKRAVRTLTVLFRRLIGYVATVGVSEDSFPEARLRTWFQMEERAISLIEELDDGLRKAATKFAETVVLALSFSGSAGSADHFTLDYLLKKRSESQFLDISVLENEGVRCVNQVVKLLHAGLEGFVKSMRSDSSTQRGLPPLSFMTEIAVLSNLVRRRRKILQYTLPPLLDVVYAITGTRGAPSRAFLDLSESQRQSILTVLRFSLRAMLAYPHVRNGRAGVDITAAMNDLANYEKEQEAIRKRNAQAAAAAKAAQAAAAAKAAAEQAELAAQNSQLGRITSSQDMGRTNASPRGSGPDITLTHHGGGQPVPDQQLKYKAEFVPAVKSEAMVHQVNAHAPPLLPMKRPRIIPQEQNRHWPRLPPPDAMAVTRALVQSMPHKEVVNFIMTRILLNIPSAESVPGALMYSARSTQTTPSSNDEPLSKRMRKSRFGSTNKEKETMPPQKKALPKRKVAPPVVVPRFSEEAAEQLVGMCCRRLLHREEEAISSGAGPLRIQMLSRLLTEFALRESETAKKFCEDTCEYIVKNINRSTNLALAWLHRLIVFEEICDDDVSASFDAYPDKDLRLSEFRTAIEIWANRGLLTNSNEMNGNGGFNPNSKASGRKEDSKLEVVELKQETEEKFDPSATDASALVADKSKVDHMEEKPALNGTLNTDSYEPKEVEDDSEEKEIRENISCGSDQDDESDDECDLSRLRRRHEGYERILMFFLSSLRNNPGENSSSFNSIVTEAPLLTNSVLDMLKILCTDPSQMKLGLSALRQIISERPGSDRDFCLELLLSLAFHDDEILRGPAIRLLANQVFSESSQEVAGIIEVRAMNALKDAVDRGDAEGSNLERDSLLLTALCGKKNELLNVLASGYIAASSSGEKVILSRAKELAQHTGMSCPSMLDLISGKLTPSPLFGLNEEQFSDGTATMAIEVLRILTKKSNKPSKEVVVAAQTRYENTKRIEFIIPVLPGLSRKAILSHLVAIVEEVTRPTESSSQEEVDMLNKDKKTSTNLNGFQHVISLLMSTRPPAISPEDLLVELHKMEPTVGVSVAIRACFESRSVFQRTVVAQSIQQILEMTAVPNLFMRTVHLARIFHPDLEKYINDTVMKRLIEKHVWSNALVWEGFLSYCTSIKNKCVPLLLSLPVSKLQDALEKEKSLVSIFEELFSDPKRARRLNNKRQREVIRGAITKRGKSRKK
ncbi:symplekin [Gracilaria domingensis]|nr:symplekin [Gracilaria domingensis]